MRGGGGLGVWWGTYGSKHPDPSGGGRYPDAGHSSDWYLYGGQRLASPVLSALDPAWRSCILMLLATVSPEAAGLFQDQEYGCGVEDGRCQANNGCGSAL